MHVVKTVEELEDIYGTPGETSLVKVADRLTPSYGRILDAAPFCALATVGPEGLDCSPRGDAHGLVTVQDSKTLLLPDRRGNNRIDSLRNVVRDPRVALMFLVPGSGNALRINGRAEISVDPEQLERFRVGNSLPRSVLVITVQEVYFQCARAIMRAELWNSEKHVDPSTIPSPGEILGEMSRGSIDASAYDEAWPERAAKTMW